MKARTVVLVGVLALYGCGGPTAEVDLFSRIESAYGGPEAVAKMDAYRVVGRLTKMMGQGEGRIVRDYRAPAGLRVAISYPTHNELRILDGPVGWRGDGPEMRPAEGPLYDSMMYHLLRSDLPGALLRNRDRVVDQGQQEREGATYQVLAMAWSETLDMKYWVDPSSARVIRAEGVLKAGPMVLDFAAEYGDFRVIDGVLVPFLEANFASGNRVATTTVESVVFSPVDLGPFAPPKPLVVPEEV